jgi:transposase
MAKPPLFVRSLTDEERTALTAGLRSHAAFVMRRCQIVLASTGGKRASQIAADLGCDTDTVLNAINAFNARGLEALVAGSHVPKVIHRGFDAEAAEKLCAMLRQSPRNFGQVASLWTLEMAAEVSFAQGITPQRVSRETVRNALLRLGVNWKRAKKRINSPDPAYGRKKRAVTA